MNGEPQDNANAEVINAAGYALWRNYPLKKKNTFRVEAFTALFAEVSRASAVDELLADNDLRNRPLLMLGEGSNLLFTRDWDGLTLHITECGICLTHDDGDTVIVRVAAGENWHNLVRWTISQNLRGLENLSLIPGTVGAAPIQNIGAYGVELSQCVHVVEAFDRTRGETVRLSAADCQFSYRSSIFKSEPQRWIICAVEFRLSRSASFTLDYAGISDELAALGIANPGIAEVSQAICRLRLRKLPNPALIANAGSFFKNPIIPTSVATELKNKYPTMPIYPAASDDNRKLAAAWLIEQCGWKGFREEDAGVSPQHALVLVNYGLANGAALWSLARKIQESVRNKFRVNLDPEPTVI